MNKVVMNKIEEDRKILITQNSYITKGDLIDILTKLNFKAIKCANIDVITDFVHIKNEDDEYVKTCGFRIDIE